MNLHLGRSTFGNSKNLGNVISQEEALNLLREWVKNDKLILHMKQVGLLMKAWARTKGYSEEDQHRWYLAGLLHDADWEKYPDQHCKVIIEELENREIDSEIIHAIASHGPKYFGVQPETEMDKMLYAFDELSGLIHAYSLMRPTAYEGMEIKGVRKRLKDKSFAAQVSREDIADACERANIELNVLIEFIIQHQPDSIN
ncbi:HD domain-containing protein [Algoriphagus sediminis]|uniref:HD domain-containing protein n=1 Tax=Algoriphagus sediminis TaxID=3057113 RepID=A0ABT7Y8P0_9BACT|nr:HD domain-containing protein [Algoriphagus sediminis]MDN3202862.1 HD domain-containing protein [Algoriphagus sediminis]